MDSVCNCKLNKLTVHLLIYGFLVQLNELISLGLMLPPTILPIDCDIPLSEKQCRRVVFMHEST